MRAMLHPAFQRQMGRLALFAMLLLALAPSISRALASPAASADGWTAICSMQGLKWVKASAGEPAAPGHAHDAGDCAYCPLLRGLDSAAPTLSMPAAPALAVRTPDAAPAVSASRWFYPSGLGSRGPPLLT
jgi:hypothetical protein